MMHKLLIIFLSLFLCLSTSAQEGYDNWYFKFFEGQTIVYAKYFDETGEVLAEASGSVVQKFNEENKVEVRSALIFKESEDEPKTTTVLTKTKNANVYIGTAEDSGGGKYMIRTEVLAGNKYKTVVSGENGVTITIDGELKEDGKVYAKEIISEDGKVTTKSEVIFSKDKPVPAKK